MKDSSYKKTKDAVFWKGKKIKDLHPKDFIVLHPILGKTKDSVYLNGKPTDLHAPSFEVLNDYLAKNKDMCFKIMEKKLKPIKMADPMSFEVLNTNYAKDINRAYFKGIPIRTRKKDIASFRPISEEYAIDDSGRVYNETIVLPYSVSDTSFDPLSFKVLNIAYWYDKNNIYYHGDILMACLFPQQLSVVGELLIYGDEIWMGKIPIHMPFTATIIDGSKHYQEKATLDASLLIFVCSFGFVDYYRDKNAVWSFYDENFIKWISKKRKDIVLKGPSGIIREALVKSDKVDTNIAFQDAYKLVFDELHQRISKDEGRRPKTKDENDYAVSIKGSEVTLYYKSELIAQNKVSAWYTLGYTLWLHQRGFKDSLKISFKNPLHSYNYGDELFKSTLNTPAIRLALIQLASALANEGEFEEAKMLAAQVFDVFSDNSKAVHYERVKDATPHFLEAQQLFSTIHPDLISEIYYVAYKVPENITKASAINWIIKKGMHKHENFRHRLETLNNFFYAMYQTFHHGPISDKLWPIVKERIEKETIGHIKERGLIVACLIYKFGLRRHVSSPNPTEREWIKFIEQARFLLQHGVNIEDCQNSIEIANQKLKEFKQTNQSK